MAVKAYTYEQAKGNIVKVGKQAASLQSMIHATAVAFLKHWHDNPKAGSEVAELMNNLMNASSYHRGAFSKWMGATIEVTYKDGKTEAVRLVPMRWSEENRTWFVHADDKIMGKQFIAARENTFWEISPPPEAKPFNDFDFLEKFFDKASKHVKEPVKGDVIHFDMIKDLRTVYAKHKQAAA